MKKIFYNTVKAVLVTALLLMAMAVIVPVFVCDQFRIGGHSMDPTLEAGDHILVNKLLFGARIYKNYDFSRPDVESFRMPGFRKIRPGDIVVFNSPDGRYNDRISFRINYVYAKRCIGTPGDTVRIVDGACFNSRFVGPVGPLCHQLELVEASDEELKAEGVVVNAAHFAGGGWTIRNFGPLAVPASGMTVSLDSVSVRQYAKVIQYETGYWPEVKQGEVFIDGRSYPEYTFNENYYFFIGDNVLDSRDSRYIGFVPEEYVVGIATRILFSEDEDGSWRKDRFFKSVAYEHTFPMSERLDRALSYAGENRRELVKVLDRYSVRPEDSLKLRSAVFLIENMPGRYYYEGKALTDQLGYYRQLREAADMGRHPTAALEMHRKKFPDFSPASVERKEDIRTVDSAYLCSNIEWAFRMWEEMPWGRSVPFEDFRDYVLPYRTGNETLSYWREDYFRQYGPLLESFMETPDSIRTDYVRAASYLLSHMTPEDPYYSSYAPSGLPNVGPQAVKYRCGTCRELTDFNTYLFRTFCIPSSVDYMPLRGDNNTGHSWTSLWDRKGNVYCEDSGKIMRVKDSPNYSAAKLKVYRASFVADGDTDVTEAYSPHYMENMPVPKRAVYPGYLPDTVYLALSRRLAWVPVVKARTDGRNVSFDDVCSGSMVRLVSIEGDRTRFWSDPFYVDSTGRYHFMSVTDSVTDMVALAKYPLRNEMGFRRRMIGGVFEGSNSPDFRPCDTLYIVEKASERLVERVRVNSGREYRYLRYYGPDSSWCHVAEIAFFGGADGGKLAGKIIGTPGSPGNQGNDTYHDYTKAFDGKTWTSVNYRYPSGGWTGMDFGRPMKITEIHYSPANRDNCIRAGDEYELYYCDKVWKSAGRKVAVTDSLLFEDVPAGTLYLLYDHTRGEQRRIFSYENGRQVWR